MWTIKARKKKLDGPLGCYNSLTDQHLTCYFSNRTVRHHLIRAGLITKEGRIISDSTRHAKEVQHQRHKQAHEILANAIVRKTIELERNHQAEIQRHLEDMYKIEVVERVKNERSKLKASLSSSPHCSSSKLASSLSDTSSLANGLHLKSSRWRESTFPLNYKLPSNCNFLSNSSTKNSEGPSLRTCHSAKGSSVKSNTRERKPDSINRENFRSKSAASKANNLESTQQSYRDAIKALFQSSVSPYLLPVFSKYATIPRTKRHNSAIHRNLDKSDQSIRDSKSANQYKHRRSIEEITAIDTYEKRKNSYSKPSKVKHVKLRKFPDSLPQVTLHYRGAMSAWQSPHSYQEVTIMQQHCGGNPICVFKSQLKGGDSFSFTSRRHLGYPFSIIIFINGIQHLRVSTCCEYRHRLGYRLGGKRGQFILANVQGSKPCFRCQVEESLGIKRPHHPKPPEYSKYLQKSKIVVDRSYVPKKFLAVPCAEFSGSAELQKKTDNIAVSSVICSEQNQSDNDSTDHSEILEIGFQNDENDSDVEKIPSENDNEEIQEQLVEETIDGEDRGFLSENEKARNSQGNESFEKIYEVIKEEDAVEGDSDGEDDVPCNETCLSFDYTADSDEEHVDDTVHGESYSKTNSFCRRKSLCNSDNAGEQDSNANNVEQLELSVRRESTDTIDSNVQDADDEWQNKLEHPQSYSSSDEEEGMQQQIVTADIHINPSNSSTKNISQAKREVLE